MANLTTFEKPQAAQAESPLFSVLPGEVRDKIFDYCLITYEDLSETYDQNTCYRRPGYLARHKTDCNLLLTCQAVYNEAWFRPWANSEHTFWLSTSSPLDSSLIPCPFAQSLPTTTTSHPPLPQKGQPVH
jgi:hypothetical protein